ncbi:MAG TPA: efflux RND transporter periplasmic adaptor subunit [Bryobacteraceae bacterium]|nr:efflux RND transporter periplasmic adaptor subunit [Bryobacteraceae bacterium]
MKTKWKALILVGLLVVVAGAVFGSIKYNQRGIVTVQTGKVARNDLTSIVTASGEVKPRNYINIGANTQGAAQITALLVKEGDHVKKGEILARLADAQPQADLHSQQAALNSAMADSAASEAAVKAYDDAITVAKAQQDHDAADLEQKKLDFARSQQLFNQNLIARQDYEIKKYAYDTSVATLAESKSKVDQARAQRAQAAAQLASAQRKIAQSEAMVARQTDVLSQYEAVAPLDGEVTDLPVRVGETVVPGIQNSASSTIMTIADMSIITAEVDVDETDIVSVKLDQAADVTIDAIPNRTFKGKVIEIGDTAIVRSTGVAASQSTTSSQEAKDFKVTIALDIPEELVRPGLSCTAKVTTATRSQVLSIPIQALTVRTKGQLTPPKPGAQPQQMDLAALKASKEEIQGVFVVKGDKAQFEKVDTGITGTTDIEVLSGLTAGDQIVTGSYSVIKSLRNDARIKIDNKPPPIAPTAT